MTPTITVICCHGWAGVRIPQTCIMCHEYEQLPQQLPSFAATAGQERDKVAGSCWEVQTITPTITFITKLKIAIRKSEIINRKSEISNCFWTFFQFSKKTNAKRQRINGNNCTEARRFSFPKTIAKRYRSVQYLWFCATPTRAWLGPFFLLFNFLHGR